MDAFRQLNPSIGFKITTILGLFFCCLSCEDVVDVDLPPTDTKLIINGIVRVDTTQEFLPIKIKVTETTDFFSEPTIAQLESAVILVGERDPDDPFSMSFGTSILKEFEPGTGIYEPDTVGLVDERIRTEFLNPNTVFFLVIEHKGKRYAAETNYSPAVPIDDLQQGDETLFDDNDTELQITITDIPEEKNHYVFDFGGGEFLALDDEFIDGQEFGFSYFLERDLMVGEELEVSILGADQQFFNYIDLLVEQTENTGGVFETPSATVRGNVFDVTGLDNINIFDNVERPNSFALGYFAVVQEFTSTVVIE
ncbi:DUF4249 family protein [Flagellimonas nanhaiensis]|uniref:DUF4249 family protein n=1 Tax=Flagellimonas nanhaiensis TaxID=2292706 RepID=A0A371JU02_9FLAO|nr:DUF4249 family protein [Allomuricauda nanhaiensis]RDY61290.1 DUF4249 family protein [Allomuricauda nanhaiensis]